MKRIIFLLFLLLSLHSQAQVHINDNGKTVVGNMNNTNAPSFTVGDYSDAATSKTYINNSTKKIGLGIRNTTNVDGTWGLRIYNYQNNIGSCIGLVIAPSGQSNQSSFGVKSYGGRTSSSAYGVFGGLQGTVTKGTGIYGSASSTTTISSTGVYAGYFNGDVYTTGNIYGTVLTRSLSSGQNSSSSSIDLDLGRSRITDRISNLNVVQAFVNEGITASEYAKRNNVSSSSADTLTLEELDRQIEETQDDITIVNSTSTGLRYGLDCRTLKEMFPELVYEDSEGNTSINYIEMIPLLVQSIKELNEEVAVLKSQLEASETESETGGDAKTNSRGKTTSVEALGQSDVHTAVLGQNNPNPFSEITTIGVTVPETVKNAHIFIYDMSGKEVKRIEIAARGKTDVSVAGEDLVSGMYLYSLIADGKAISTKRMILAK